MNELWLIMWPIKLFISLLGICIWSAGGYFTLYNLHNSLGLYYFQRNHQKVQLPIPTTRDAATWQGVSSHKHTHNTGCLLKPRQHKTSDRYWLWSYCIYTQCSTHTHYTEVCIWGWKILQTLTCGVETVGIYFRRPEGKFKKKQTPHDEALQILKPQMDNPPAPQVCVHTHVHSYTRTACKMLKSLYI